MPISKDIWTCDGIVSAEPPLPPELGLSALTYDSQDGILPPLLQAIDAAGGWVLNRRMTSPVQMELTFEVQMRALMELYAALVSSGVELTRESHLLLTERCTVMKHRADAAMRSAIATIRLDLAFLSMAESAADRVLVARA